MTSPMENKVDWNEEASGPMESVEEVPAKGSRQRQMRSLLVRVSAGAVAVAALIFGILYYLHSLSYESTDDAFIDGHIIAISPRVSGHVAKVYVTDNQWVKAGDRLIDLDPADFQARLDAAKAALAAARATRKSRDVEVDLTTITTAADLDGAHADVEAAKAALEAARAQAAQTASQYEQAKAQIAITAAALAQAKAEADAVVARHTRDAEDLKRYEEMRTARTVSGRDLDHAVADERISAADLASAQKKIETYRSMLQQSEAALKAAEDNRRRADAQVMVSSAQLDQAEARLAVAQSAPKQVEQRRSLAEVSSADAEKAKAEVDQARLNLSYTRIDAPADGFVTKKAVEPGSFVQVGQSLLAIVPKKVWVTANFKETQLTHMRPGQRVEIKVDAYPDLTLEGHVESIQRGTGARFSLLPPENATGNYVKVVQRVPVKITFDTNPDSGKVFLSPGMSVVPDVNVSDDGSALKVEGKALAAP